MNILRHMFENCRKISGIIIYIIQSPRVHNWIMVQKDWIYGSRLTMENSWNIQLSSDFHQYYMKEMEFQIENVKTVQIIFQLAISVTLHVDLNQNFKIIFHRQFKFHISHV